MSENKNSQVQIAVRKDRLLGLGVGTMAFIFLFLNWFKVTFFGYTKSFSMFQSGMFDLSALLGLGKILVIITIITFIIYLVSCFVNLKTLIPALEKVDVDKYSAFLYFGTYALALIFSILGIITTEYVGVSIGWVLALVFCTLGFVILVKPDLVNKIMKK